MRPGLKIYWDGALGVAVTPVVGALLPDEFTARTQKVYAVSFVRPVTMVCVLAPPDTAVQVSVVVALASHVPEDL